MVVAIYRNPKTNLISIVYPIDPNNKNIIEIFENSIPEGVPFWTVLAEELPHHLPIECWEIDETIPPNGYGKRRDLNEPY